MKRNNMTRLIDCLCVIDVKVADCNYDGRTNCWSVVADVLSQKSFFDCYRLLMIVSTFKGISMKLEFGGGLPILTLKGKASVSPNDLAKKIAKLL